MSSVIKLPRICMLCKKYVSPLRYQQSMPGIFTNVQHRTFAFQRSSKRKTLKKISTSETAGTETANVKPLIVELLSDDVSSTGSSESVNMLKDIESNIKDLEKLLSAASEFTKEYHEIEEDSLPPEANPESFEPVLPDSSQQDYVEELALDIPQKWDQFQVTLPGQSEDEWGGACDESVPSSGVPCPGCGAELQCQRPRSPGYIPAEKYKSIPPAKLRDNFCRRCNLMRHYDQALNASVKPEEYVKILAQIKDVYAVTLLIVDLTDLPNSLFRGLSSVIGRRRPLYILGNKVDLLPHDGPGYLNEVKKTLEDVCRAEGLHESMYVHYVGLISAKTGYGIEELITTLFTDWSRRGHVYLLGCTNVGKSTLFNSLMMSDYCKAGAREYVHRATTSLWPGTTLNLLQFPITNAVPSMIYERVKRIISQRKQNAQQTALDIAEGKVKSKASRKKLEGQVGQTFLSRREERLLTSNDVIHGYDTATYSFVPKTGVLAETTKSKKSVRLEATGEKGEYDDKLHDRSKWCYDTPGVINPQQVINILTQAELSVIVHKSAIRPRFYVMKPSQVMFVSGIGRLEYLQGSDSAQIAVFASSGVPVFVCDAEEADNFYRANIGTAVLGVPLGDQTRLMSVPALIGRQFTLTGSGTRQSCADITLSSVGWVAVSGYFGAEMRFRAYTPGGVGCVLREPGMLRNLVRHRGKRIKGTATYMNRS